MRAIAYVQPGRLRLESRNLNEITDAYPEVRGLIGALGMHEAVLDGEIVAFDDGRRTRPSFERLQRRMHVTSPAAVRRLMRSTPVVYAIFDLLYLDGHSLMDLPVHRAARAARGARARAGRRGASRPRTRGDGARLLEATAEQGLEGVVAKRLDSRYEPGRRSGAWLKIKNTLRQELVIAGWLPGEGRRTDRIGALLDGVYEDGRLRYAGRVGTGFTEKTLDDLRQRLAPLRRDTSPFERVGGGWAGTDSPRGGVRRAAAGRRGRVPRVDHRAGDARALVQGAARGQAGDRGGARGDGGRRRRSRRRIRFARRRCSTRSSGCPRARSR